MATKGGQMPLSIEKRAKGKKVTVISGVQGNASALCSALTRLLGIGGTTHVRGALCADVEVQGEQVERVTEILGQLGCVRGLPKSRETAAVVVERDCAYDSLLTEQSGRAKPRAPKAAPPPPEPPEDAPCRAWHGRWIYCSGNCEQIEFDDIWADSNSNPYFRPRTPPVHSGLVSASVLSAALRPLGMTAEVGAAVQEWINHKAQMAKEAERKRSMPIASLCAVAPAQPKGAALVCDECGAEFALKRTLKMHKLAHKREREEAAAWGAEQYTAEAHWRCASAEQAAVLEARAEEDEVWTGFDACASSSDGEYCPSRAAPSLASWLTAAARPAAQNQRHRKQKPNPAVQQTFRGISVEQVSCPVCCEFFPSTEIERHVDVCLAASAERGSDVEPMISSKADEEGDDGVLPLELLESLLEMELSEEAAERFWQRFEDATQARGLPVREAFLVAIEAALQEDEEEPAPRGLPSQRRPADTASSPRQALANSTPLPSGRELKADCKESGSAGAEWQTVSNRWSRKTAAKDSNGPPSREAGRWTRAPQEGYPGQPATGAAAVQKTPPSVSATAPACRKGQGRGAGRPPCKPSPVPAPCPSCGLPFLPEILELHASQCAARQADAPPGSAQHADWLQAALAPLLGADAAESIAAGVQVVIEHGDEEAAANAVELVAAELPASGPEAARGDLILAEFSARLFTA